MRKGATGNNAIGILGLETRGGLRYTIRNQRREEAFMNTQVPLDGLRVGHYRRVLFCTDFTPQADAAFDYAVDAALRNTGSTLYLLHVVQEPDAQFWRNYMPADVDPGDLLCKKAEERLRDVYRDKVPGQVKLTVKAISGDPVQAILWFAEEEKIDLLVMGRARKGMFAKWITGNVMGRVASRANCPLLVIPVGDEAPAAPEKE